MNKTVGLMLLLIAYGLLFPGLTQPLLSLTGVVDRADLAQIGKDIIVENPETPEFIGTMANVLLESMQIAGTVEAYQKTRSILGTVEELYQNKHVVVAFLVALFSIIIPVVKGLILIVTSLKISPGVKTGLKKFSGAISKWSMADVFVIGVFVAYLAANAVEKEGGLLTFEAELGSGFYYFLGYCLVSILATQILLAADKKSLV